LKRGLWKGSKVQGRVLIIDGISTNRIVLKVKLSAAFYHVTQAGTMAEAMDLIRIDKPDLVVTAINLPDGTAAELCRRLRVLHPASPLPVLAIASSANPQARIDTLRAGAFDVMDKPINETLLLGRVRNMMRADHKIAEWQFRDDTTCALGLAEAPTEFVGPGSIAVIGLEAASLQGWVRQLLPHLRARYCVTPLRDAMASLHSKLPPDAVVLALPDTPEQSEGCLRLISALRASVLTRDIALLVIQKTPDPARATSALDMGADDIMTSGFDAQEVALRMQVLLRRKRQVARMLQSVRTGLREVVHDPLTGLYNRRFAMPYMTRLMDQSIRTNSPFALVIADMDHFKRINDQYGHASGDAVLEETARRLRDAVRGTDMIARMGGEEFLIAMPDTDAGTARGVANRLCRAIGSAPFTIPGARDRVSVTVSLGLALGAQPMQMNRHTHEKVEAVLDRADKALYAAKIQGRNRFAQSQPETRPAA
jgi:two-component system cell cycle response regulator